MGWPSKRKAVGMGHRILWRTEDVDRSAGYAQDHLQGYRKYNWDDPPNDPWDNYPQNDPWDDLPQETQWAWGTEFYEEQKMLICQQGMHRVTEIVGVKESMYSTLCQNLDWYRLGMGMTCDRCMWELEAPSWQVFNTPPPAHKKLPLSSKTLKFLNLFGPIQNLGNFFNGETGLETLGRN